MRVLLLALTLAGCATQQAGSIQRPRNGGVPPQMDELQMCDAAPVQRQIGKKRTERLGAQILRQSSSQVIRWIYPNQPVTMDYSTVRINVELEQDGTIRAINCG